MTTGFRGDYIAKERTEAGPEGGKGANSRWLVSIDPAEALRAE